MRYNYYVCKNCHCLVKIPAVGVDDNQKITCNRCGYTALFYKWRPYKKRRGENEKI